MEDAVFQKRHPCLLEAIAVHFIFQTFPFPVVEREYPPHVIPHVILTLKDQCQRIPDQLITDAVWDFNALDWGVLLRIIDPLKCRGWIEVLFDCEHQHTFTIIDLPLKGETVDKRLSFLLCQKLILLMVSSRGDWSAPR